MPRFHPGALSEQEKKAVNARPELASLSLSSVVFHFVWGAPYPPQPKEG